MVNEVRNIRRMRKLRPILWLSLLALMLTALGMIYREFSKLPFTVGWPCCTSCRMLEPERSERGTTVTVWLTQGEHVLAFDCMGKRREVTIDVQPYDEKGNELYGVEVNPTE